MSDTEELLIGVGVFIIMVLVPLVIAIATDFRKKK